MAPHLIEHPRVALAWANLRSKMGERSKYRANQNEYKKFCRWVEREGLRSADVGEDPIFVNRLSIDEYFRKVVISRVGNKNTVTRIRNCLQYFYDNIERKLPRAPPAFTVQSPSVDESLKTQQERWRTGELINEGTVAADPHNGLKDRMPTSDKKTIIHYVHGHRKDWGSLGMSFCWGNNAGVRGASSRKLVYADLNMSWGFGPVDVGEHARILMLVLRKGDGVHKDCFVTDKQVGVWRHKHYLLCAAFNTALHVINELRQNSTINFYHANKNQRASWWDTPLVEFEDGNQESAAMSAVLKATGVSSCKVTHHRTQAVQHGGAEGLAPWQISTFTKHMTEKLNSAYFPECNHESMHVMSDHKKSEPYGAYYRYARLQHTPTHYVRLLLPKYDEWCSQQSSAEGDKSTCCSKFLQDILPFLAEVLVTGGIYLIKDLPRHPMSQYLRVSCLVLLILYSALLTSVYSILFQNQIVDFSTWAATERLYVEDLQSTRRRDEMVALNVATRAAVESLQLKFERVEIQFSQYRAMADTKLQALVDSNERLTNAILRLVDSPIHNGVHAGVPPPPPPLPPGRDDNQPRLPEDVPAGSRVSDPVRPLTEEQEEQVPEGVSDQVDLEDVAAAATNQPPAATNVVAVSRGELVETEFRARARIDARQVIQGMALQPPLKNARCPSTWVKCLTSWQGQNLQYWAERPSTGWDTGVVSAFNKRKGIHREIVRFRDVDNAEGDVASPLCTLESAAKLLDRLRKDAGMNLTDHFTSRRKDNPSVQSRRKTNNNLPAVPPPPPTTPTQARGATRPNPVQNAGPRPRHVSQQRRPRHAPVEDEVDAFAAAFPGVGPPQYNQMQRERESNWLRQGQAEQEVAAAELERRRTTGSDMYRHRAVPDQRNFGDLSRIGRDSYARRELGS
jgi:hypothetical protein